MAHPLAACARPLPGARRGAGPSLATCRAGVHGAHDAPAAPAGLAVLGVALLTVPAAFAVEVVDAPAEPHSITVDRASAAAPAGGSQLLSDYPALPYAGGLLVGAPALIAAASRQGGKVKATSPDGAYAALASDDSAVLVDIRSVAQRASGDPDLRGLKKRVLQLPFTKARPSRTAPAPTGRFPGLCAAVPGHCTSSLCCS
jgi:hypothetical protein